MDNSDTRWQTAAADLSSPDISWLIWRKHWPLPPAVLYCYIKSNDMKVKWSGGEEMGIVGTFWCKTTATTAVSTNFFFLLFVLCLGVSFGEFKFTWVHSTMSNIIKLSELTCNYCPCWPTSSGCLMFFRLFDWLQSWRSVGFYFAWSRIASNFSLTATYCIFFIPQSSKRASFSFIQS